MGPTARLIICAALAWAALLTAACSNGDPVDPSAKVLVALALESDDSGLYEAAGRASTGASESTSERFLTLSEIASRYGAATSVVESATKELAKQGLQVKADPTNSVLWGEVEVATAEELFGVGFETQTSDGSQSIRATGDPTVPRGVKGIADVVGLSATLPGKDEASSSTTAALPACPGGEVTRTSLAEKFGFEELFDIGATGDGVTVAMLEVESFDPQVFDTYNSCAGTQLETDHVSETSVEASPPPSPGSEIALDTVTIALAAPGAQQQITRFDPESSIVFPLLSILDSVGETTTPEVLLSTVGFCEEALSDAEVEMGERLLATFALTGTTTVASSGDTGSSSCHPDTSDPTVQYPASSAWVTAVGGASFDGTAATPSNLSVWNSDPDDDNAGGGGRSARVDRPSWQSTTEHDGDKRAVPDFSAFATPGGVGLVPTCSSGSCEWQALGGTSLSGAAVAGGLAVVLQPVPRTDTPRRVGHLAPVVHDSGVDSAVDITSGNNHVFTKKCCSAGDGYDLASGWGLLDLTEIVGVDSANR